MKTPAARSLGSVAGRYRLPAAWRRPAAPRPAAPPPSAEEAEPAADTPIGRLEAVLWMAEAPLTDRRLARLAALNSAGEARELIDELRRRYAARGAAFDVASVAGGRRLLTRPEYERWLGAEGAAAAGLSGAAMETLAVAAYRQPVLRAEVEAIRGVGCGELLRQLLDADLLRIVGRSEELGRPLLYATTERFLEVFGLGKLDDLPGLAASAADARPTRNNASASPPHAA